VGGDRTPPSGGLDPVGRSRQRLRHRCSRRRPAHLALGCPDPGHLLWTPPDGARPGRGGRARYPARVRAGDRGDDRGGWHLRGARPRAAGLDEPRRLDRPPARRVQRHRAHRVDRVRRTGGHDPAPLRHPVPSRGGPYARRPGHPPQLRDRRGRRPPELDARSVHRDHGRRDQAPGGGARHRERVGRSGPLCALGRRRLRCRRHPGPSRGR
jgi:hypothetical protein